MSGTVNIARGLFEHEAFSAEPLTEREAWIWLIMEASWKARPKRVGSTIVELKRGQLASSIRFMAGAWKWTAPRVQRYLKRLESLKMIEANSDTGVTVITVCNYDEFQSGGKAADTAPIQDRYTTDTNEKKGVIREEGKEEETSVEVSRAPIPADDIAEAVSAYNRAAARQGWPQIKSLSNARRSALRGRLSDAGGIDGWVAALERAEASDFLCGRKKTRDGPFVANFDFLTRQSKFAALMEGNYDNRTAEPARHAPHRPENRTDPAIEQIARLAGLV